MKNLLTKEQARELLAYIYSRKFIVHLEDGRKIQKGYISDLMYLNWKEKGYIKKDPVEEAKKQYNKWAGSSPQYRNNPEWYDTIIILMDAIEYLENKLKENEKENI